MALHDYPHKSELLNISSLDDLSIVSRSVHLNWCFILILFLENNAAWIELGGTLYKRGVFVVTSSELLPQFSQIVDIVVTERSQCFFICEEYETICFCKHYHAYELSESNPRELYAD